jgi:hypothetical protein
MTMTQDNATPKNQTKTNEKPNMADGKMQNQPTNPTQPI